MTPSEYLRACGWRRHLMDLSVHVGDPKDRYHYADPVTGKWYPSGVLDEAVAIQVSRDRDRFMFVAERLEDDLFRDDAREVMRRDWGEHRDGKS